jgi:prepilin-type N-terminal cleavage/methylation domain-containing protein
MSTRGFTLVELMIALALGLVVAGLAQRQLLIAQRLARAQGERLAMQDNARAALTALAAEQGGLGQDEITAEASAALGAAAEFRSDLIAIATGAVTYQATRGEGWVCWVPPPPAQEIVLAASAWRSVRAPRATDSIVVFAESDSHSSADDAWVHLGVVSSAVSSCPDGSAGLAVRVAVPAALSPAALLSITPGAPARLTEVMEARSYASGGKTWLGLRSVSTGEAITPVAGPLADSTASVRGLTLSYRDAADAPTSDPAAVRAVEIAVIAVTDQPIHGRDLRGPAIDTLRLATRVALRNGRQP